ncbi:unnamed protein product [Urochloa decumbens]|uniref:Uncharacterized protein n=1 Tax=Urochloa decumbens TaxID=240449 RepID=A0ABC8VEG0_9POAL
MASRAGMPGAAYSYRYRSRSGSYSYTAITNHQLTRQRSMPAALAAAFTSCGRGDRPRSLGDGGDVDVDESLGRRAPAARSAPGGAVGAVVRAVLAWIRRGRRKAAAMGLRRSGSLSSAGKEQRYGDEESYAQNFDEGDAAAEPENLSRSFSARYARRAPWRDGAR